MRRLTGKLLLMLLAVGLAACAASETGRSILEDRLSGSPSPSAGVADKKHRLDKFLAENAPDVSESGFDGFVQEGSDDLTAASVTNGDVKNDAEDVIINLVGAPIAQAAKSVLGDVLGLNYSIDGRVQGAITIQTSTPVSPKSALGLFEAALRDNGATIAASGDHYRIVPLAEAGRNIGPIANGEGETVTGLRQHLIALRFVSANELLEVLEPMLPQGMVVRVDQTRNSLVLSGTPLEIASIKETIAVFDVDWMRGMSFAMIPVRNAPPSAIVEELEQIFDSKEGASKGIIRFIANRRLKSVLVISSRAKYMKSATSWIRKLDALAETGAEGLHVYRVQNRKASELAGILAPLLDRDLAQLAESGSGVAPKYDPATARSDDSSTDNGVDDSPTTPPAGTDDQSERGPSGRIRVVADDTNNALLISCTKAEFGRILAVLEEVDTIPNQVLLEAIIAEVSLDDDLRFGVRWFLGDKNHSGTFSDAATGAVASTFPGFSYFLKANDIGLSLNAISSVTDVRVLSAPSLVVLDNRTATLQVGDQVPIVTRSSKGVVSEDAPIVANVELKDTGVILRVTPQVNDSGLVTLDIEQEVSTVVATTTSGIDSPTIRQRKLNTSVVVSDSEALALGGLIQERETTGKTKVPVLGDIPLLGVAFRQKADSATRTELIIFIRPRVIRDIAEARQVTAEFREQLSVKAPRVRREEPSPADELLRILN